MQCSGDGSCRDTYLILRYSQQSTTQRFENPMLLFVFSKIDGTNKERDHNRCFSISIFEKPYTSAVTNMLLP